MNLLNLPIEIIEEIVLHLDIDSLKSLNHTCRLFHNIINCRYLWYRLFCRDYYPHVNYNPHLSFRKLYFKYLDYRGRYLAFSRSQLTQELSKVCQDNKGDTLARLLVFLGADAHLVVLDKGMNILHWCVFHNYYRLIKVVLQQGLDPNMTNDELDTPLNWAVRYNYYISKILLDFNADPNIPNKDGMTAIFWAVMGCGRVDIVSLLVEKGARINIKNKIGWSPLHYAVKNNNLELVRFLIERGADVNSSNILGCTLLHTAVWYDYNEIVEELLRHGAYVDSQDNMGETPLHHGVINDSYHSVLSLLAHKADTHIKNCYGRTPVELVERKNTIIYTILHHNQIPLSISAQGFL